MKGSFAPRVSVVMLLTGAALAWVLGGPLSALYLIVLIGASTVGWPVGLALFGRHPLAIVAGTALGYALTALALWAGIRLGSSMIAAAVWTATAAAGWFLVRRRGTGSAAMATADGRRALPEWRAPETRALAALLLLTAVLVVPPFLKVGARRDDGARLYRAYFTADFVWHMALTAELAKGDMPPRNPYLNGERLHYYWTYFLPPAAAVRALALPVADALKVTALFAAFTFMAAVFALAWVAVPRGSIVLVAATFGLLAASFEGTYALYDLWRRGAPLSGVTDLNIDAMSAWRFRGLRIDGLARAMWYNPQHSMALALAAPAIMTITAAGAFVPVRAVLLVGLCLAASVTFNPFVAALVALVYGLAVVADTARRRLDLGMLLRHAAAVGPMLIALAWAVGNEVAEGAGDAVRFGYGGAAARQPVLSLLLSLGPLLAVAVAGASAAFRKADPSRLVPAALGSGIALATMFGMRLNVDEAWVGFRTGHILQVMLVVLVAGGLAHVGTETRTLARARVVACLAAASLGLPTTIIDYWNAQDVGNTRIGAGGFRWTVAITPTENAVLSWIRTNTPTEAIVQMDALPRGRETWSLIPSFAERRMAAGMPISLLNVPEYRARSQTVHAMYGAPDAATAWRIARELGIDYVYADGVEREAHREGLLKFDEAPDLFQRAARRGDAAVWRVLPASQ